MTILEHNRINKSKLNILVNTQPDFSNSNITEKANYIREKEDKP